MFSDIIVRDAAKNLALDGSFSFREEDFLDVAEGVRSGVPVWSIIRAELPRSGQPAIFSLSVEEGASGVLAVRISFAGMTERGRSRGGEVAFPLSLGDGCNEKETGAPLDATIGGAGSGRTTAAPGATFVKPGTGALTITEGPLVKTGDTVTDLKGARGGRHVIGLLGQSKIGSAEVRITRQGPRGLSLAELPDFQEILRDGGRTLQVDDAGGREVSRPAPSAVEALALDARGLGLHGLANGGGGPCNPPPGRK